MSLDDRLRQGLVEAAESQDPQTESMLHRVVSTNRQRAKRRRFLVGATSLASVAAVAAALVVVTGPREKRPVSPVQRLVAPSVDVEGTYDFAVGAGAAWAMSEGSSGTRLLRIDSDGRVTEIGEVPLAGVDIAYGEDHLWITDNQSVTKVSTEGDVVDSAQVPSASGITFNDDVYVTGNSDGIVTHLSAESLEVIVTYDVCSRGGDVFFAADELWIDCDPALTHLDTVTGKPLQTFDRTLLLDSDEVGIWAVEFGPGNPNPRPVRLDGRTGEPGTELPGKGETVALAAGESFVWAAEYNDEARMRVFPHDPQTGEIAGSPVVLPLTARLPLLAGDGRIWFRDEDRGVFSFAESR